MLRAVVLALLLAGCASSRPADPQGSADSTDPHPSPWSSESQPSSGSGETTAAEPRTALFALVVRSTWINRTSGEGYPSTHFGGHCGEASWSTQSARIEVHRFDEAADPWPATGILVTATAHAGFDGMGMAGNTAPSVAAFDAEAGSIDIPAAVVEHGALARLDASGSALAVDGVPLARNETAVLDRFYTVEHSDGRWDVHERLSFTDHGEATVTVTSTEAQCI
jgi:hypothetical protein